jgi:hypothetical protein
MLFVVDFAKDKRPNAVLGEPADFGERTADSALAVAGVVMGLT